MAAAKKSKQVESSRRAHQRRREQESTVSIPSLSRSEKRRRAKLEADNEAWIWEMCGPKSGIREPLTRKFTSQQCEMIGAYAETLSFGGDELLLASRGEGKTTYFRSMLWKTTVDGTVDFAAFIAATGADANNSADTIKDMTMRSDPFLKLYPEVAVPCRSVGSTSQLANTMRATGARFDDGRKRFEKQPISFKWSKEIDFPDVPGSPSAGHMIRFRGADSPIRGLNIYGKRPKVIAIDDLDTPETVNNIDQANKIIRRVNMDIGGLGTDTEPLARIMLATLPEQGCGVAHNFAVLGQPFVVRRFRYLIEKPKNMEMWMEYVRQRQRDKVRGDKYGRTAHRFYLEHREAMDQGAVISNPHRFNSLRLPDGSQTQVSALQNYFDEWADKGEMYCRCELDNEIIEVAEKIESKLEIGHVSLCEGTFDRKTVDPTTQIVVRGIDVRKIELHFSTMASDDIRPHRVVDYDVRSHGTSEITVEQAEGLILEGLHRLADEWDRHRFTDTYGSSHSCDLTLVDKGWMGNWKEDGATKTWARQPVESFCMERGLRRFLPAKGAPTYDSPAPSDTCIIGDNWHMNRGEGAKRACTEVIWNAEHWHSFVEELFMLPEDDDHRFELFAAGDGIWTHHKRLGEHIREGAHELADLRQRATRTRKTKFRRDHWWDSFAMMLVARSIEQWFRENLKPRIRHRSINQSQNVPLEIGAR